MVSPVNSRFMRLDRSGDARRRDNQCDNKEGRNDSIEVERFSRAS